MGSDGALRLFRQSLEIYDGHVQTQLCVRQFENLWIFLRRLDSAEQFLCVLTESTHTAQRAGYYTV